MLATDHVLSPVVPAEMVVCSSITVTTLLHDLSKLYDLKQGFNGGPPSSGLFRALENQPGKRLELGHILVLLVQTTAHECFLSALMNALIKYLLGVVIMRSVKTSNISSRTSWTPSLSIIEMSFLTNEC